LREPSRHFNAGCGLGDLKDFLSADDWAKLQEVLNDPLIRSQAIASALQSAGYRITSTTVGRHRRRGLGNGCQCEP
jgi:hypothetical protein